ncbi:TonB-dependent receptor [Sphingomonas koreensis]|uniref:TonB-dependent receptor n=2 Tax=Sphingomonas koreensis TaxID=93064 RepID=A0A430G4L1_9SPHN|nr:TonB-dependent receptor [Sphingomonas koreensis]RSY86897.1 TonB-dependent receptor [Sphingomonas koreensis]
MRGTTRSNARLNNARLSIRLAIGASSLAIAATPALAQDTQDAPPPTEEAEEVLVTGIRASLAQAMTIKRDAQGVVDAISAEDIGKFPDTNLAESLQRITGVSIDRSNGEGSFVTVRGFGPEFNLVTLNGRQMPTSGLGDGASAPATRSFDFANLASEGIAGVEVYKTGRAAIPSGGIGSSINIKTPRPLDRPGLRGSIAVKGVLDSSYNQGDEITPEVSGIFSTTLADDKVGILIAGSYQKRKASNNDYKTDWRDGYLGSENNWGSLAQPGDPRYANITNRPDANDVYEVAQNGSYNLNDIERERINGQLVLQFRPIESLTATFDYTYSRNTVEVRTSSVGIWFNHNDTSSAWTDGPVAGPVFYSEAFGANERKDLSYSGALTANRSENHSFGGNLTWEAPGGVTAQIDFHHSTATSKPTNKYGTSVSVGNAVFGLANQRINFDTYLPVITTSFHPGFNPLDTSQITPTGNAFRNAYFRDEINQAQLKARYDHEGGLLDSIDFGVSYVENKVRSAYGFLQNETWSGAGPASDIPDDIFKLVSLPDKFRGLDGAGNIIPSLYSFDFERMVDIIEQRYGTCSRPQTGKAPAGSCLADFTIDRRITEKTLSPYVQVAGKFSAFGNDAHVVAGLRYEHTSIDSMALVPIPNGTSWDAANEFYISYSGQSDFSRFKGDYELWLPAIDFDISPFENVKLRASYSHTITRADYASLQGGLTLDTQFRIAFGGGSRGNPGLLPYKSKNIDLSAEWYYGPSSYISVGFFNKDVENFIAQDRVTQTAFGLRTVAGGPRYQAALAALGSNASAQDIRQYIFVNFPGSTQRTGVDPSGYITGKIFALPEDPLVPFQVNTPVNNDRTANLYGFEFAVQHSFWDTGFGAILNYTIVRGDATYDNSKPSSVTPPQFALTGLSDSANAVLFYDKNGIQARVAYNWRQKFLSGTGANPSYVEDYGQIDASASYEFMPGLTVFGEVINLTGESRRGHRRSDRNVYFASPGYARYAAGVRFNF